MSRRLVQTAACMFAVTLGLGLTLGGCGGGGNGGGTSNQGSGVLQTVSFLGYAPGPGIGFNGTVPLPEVFRDQALEFAFDGPIDPSGLGGFFRQGVTTTDPCGTGANVEFLGVAPAGSTGVPYYAFCNQTLARNALQIRENAALGPQLPSYILGVHRDKPNVVVVDPRIDATNPFSLTPSQGFKATTEYVYIIPVGNALRVGGREVTAVGPNVFALPIAAPPFSTQPALSQIFRSGVSFGPDPIPPAIVSITAQSGHLGTPADPILEQDPIVITFTKRVSAASIDTIKNAIFRNINVTNTSNPLGVPVPGSLDPLNVGVTDDSAYVFTPTVPYGPGTAGVGYDIAVRIGSFGAPANVIPPIKGVPTGLSGTQLDLSNSLAVTLRSTPCAGGCPSPASVTEPFDTQTQQDTTFVPPFAGTARWNAGSAPGFLTGRVISGSPTGNNLAALGTRSQFTVDPTPPTTTPFTGLFSPFDSAAAFSGGACGAGGCNLGTTVNPNGGSHIMHLYESTELGSLEDSLEMIEWSPVNGVTIPTTYPAYQIWCGLTSTAAPLNSTTCPGSATCPGLATVYDQNYNLATFQPGTAIPAACTSASAANPDKVACGGPTAYSVTLATTAFFPFPILQPCFDFATSTGQSGSGVNLLFEQNIESGTQAPNFNRYRATAFTPVRRLIAAPLSLNAPGNCAFGVGGSYDIYRARFTMVGLVSSARSLWYDTGTPDPQYVNFILNPSILSQPAGTQSIWILEATDTANPGPGTTGVSITFVNAAGTVNTAGLTTLGNLRYFRFRTQLRANNLTNVAPTYGSVTMAYTF